MESVENLVEVDVGGEIQSSTFASTWATLLHPLLEWDEKMWFDGFKEILQKDINILKLPDVPVSSCAFSGLSLFGILRE